MMRPVTVLLLSRTKHLYERVSIWMVIQIRHWRLHSDTFLCLMKWQRIPPHCSPEPSSSVGHWATPSQQNQRKQRRLALQPTFLGSPCRRRRLPILSPRGRGYSSDGKYGFRNLTDPYARGGLDANRASDGPISLVRIVLNPVKLILIPLPWRVPVENNVAG